MTVPTRDQATRDARRITLLGTGAVLWVLAWNVVGIWTRRADVPSQWPAALLVLVESTVALVVGLLVVRRHPRNVVGWLLVAHAMAVALVMSGNEQTSGSAVAAWGTQLTQGSWVLLFVFIALIGYVFPTGEFLSRRWRRYVFACLAGHVVFLVAAALDASSLASARCRRSCSVRWPVRWSGCAGPRGRSAGSCCGSPGPRSASPAGSRSA